MYFCPMRIGYDAKRFFHNTTGLGNYSRDLIRILSRDYPGNTYLLYNPKPGKVKRFVPDGKISLEKLPSTAPGRLFPAWWRSRGMLRDLVKDQVDVFHGLSGELPWGIRDASIPSVVTIHDLIFMYYPDMYSAIDRMIYTRKFRYAAHTADRVVAVSEKTREDIVEYLGVPREKIQVIYQGCHPAFKKEIPQQVWTELQSRYALPESFILYVGSLNRRKNAFTLVQALQRTDEPLVLVGSGGAYFEKIRQYVEEHKMQDRVFFLQGLNMEQIAELYRHAMIFVYPSLFEGFGIPLIEALYSGTPVITTAGGVFPEAAGPGSVYLDDPENPDELHEKITYLLNREDLRRQMAEEGKVFVQKFNDETIAKNWHQLYNELAKKT